METFTVDKVVVPSSLNALKNMKYLRHVTIEEKDHLLVLLHPGTRDVLELERNTGALGETPSKLDISEQNFKQRNVSRTVQRPDLDT